MGFTYDPTLFQQQSNQPQNAAAGALTTTTNQGTQAAGAPAKTGGNAFADMLQHAQAFNAAAQSARQPLPPVDPVVAAPRGLPLPGVDPVRAPGAITSPPNALQAAQQAGAPQQVTPQSTPHMAASTATSPLTGGAGTGGALPGGGDVASTGQAGEWPPHQGDINPESGKPYASTQVPPGIDQATWNTVDRWVQDAAGRGADYWYLYQKPELVSQFKQWQGADWATRSKVDPVDWLKAQGMPSSEAGRSGVDTYQQWQAAQANAPGGSNTPSTYNSGVQVGADGFLTQGGQPVLDGSGNRVKPTQGPNGQWLDQFGHPILTANGTPWAPPAATPTPTTPAPGTTPPGTTPPPTHTGPLPPVDPVVDAPPQFSPLQTPDSHQSSIQKLFNPQFENQMNSLDRGLRAQAALTGEQNSGGFGANMGLANAQLAGDQSSKLADLTFKADQANQDRSMQKYQIDQASAASKYIAQLNNETEIAKMNSSADVQKYISDHANDLAKYGIDKNDALARYEAEYQRITAQMNQSAAHAGDAAQAALRNTLAKLQSDTDNRRLALEEQANTNSYNLGVGSLDVNRENNLMQFILGLGNQSSQSIRDLLASLGLTPPGNTIVQP